MPANETVGANESNVPVGALERDIADIARQLGVRSVRASIVELATMNLGLVWSFADQAPSPADSSFSTTPSSFSGLFDMLPGESLVRRLSPRRWAFAWRLDGDRAVFGEAHFVERRDELGRTDTALLRLVCDSGIRSIAVLDRDDADSPEAADHMGPVPADRRVRSRATARDRAVLGCAVLATLLAGWLALGMLPQWQRSSAAQTERIGQLTRRADATVSNRLAAALATGDYGEVQSELASMQSLGYFAEAVVTNARHRVVASAGPVVGQPIGSEIDPDHVPGRHRLPLLIGSQTQGNVWLDEPLPAQTEEGGAAPALSLAAATFALSALGATLLLLRVRAFEAGLDRLVRLVRQWRKRDG